MALPDIVLFDLDGTLVDSAPGLRDALNALLAEHGRRSLGLDEVHRFIGEGLDLLLDRAFRATGEARDPATLRARWLELYAAHAIPGSRPYPGADALLAELRAAGCHLGLVTNKPLRPSLQILEARGWSALFAVVVGGDSLPRRKPDPAPLRHALAQLPPGRAAFIGDSVIDAAAAAAAGLPLVLVGHGYAHGDLDRVPAAARVEDLPGVLAALRGLFPPRGRGRVEPQPA